MEGGYITEKIEEDLTYDYLHSSEENLWSVLCLTGLSYQGQGIRTESFSKGKPNSAKYSKNAEIREIFETTIVNWFDDRCKKWNRQKLFEAVWTGDAAQLEERNEQAFKKNNQLSRLQGRFLSRISGRDFLQEQAIWWSQIRSMEGRAMWLFLIR